MDLINSLRQHLRFDEPCCLETDFEQLIRQAIVELERNNDKKVASNCEHTKCYKITKMDDLFQVFSCCYCGYTWLGERVDARYKEEVEAIKRILEAGCWK